MAFRFEPIFSRKREIGADEEKGCLVAPAHGSYWHIATARQVAIAVAIWGKADICQSAESVAFDP
jgi:hypothetical protein